MTSLRTGAAPLYRVVLLRSGACVLLCALAACTVQATYLSTAESAYGDGRYLEVAEDLARYEHEVTQLTADKQARYGVFRGLALLRLGDYEGARRWLRWAEQVDHREPSLDPGQRQLLTTGLSEVAKLIAPPPQQ